jgi:DNA-binding transcriptional regulator/RsmH inhibitor MraZ
VTPSRLSPKNQVTIPREARVLGGNAKIEHLRAKRHVVRAPENNEQYRVVLLMTETELAAREQRILADPALSDDQKFAYVTRLNAEMKLLAIDAQNRVVLPSECVAHLGVGDSRDVQFVCTNTLIQVWNPDHFQRYASGAAPAAPDAGPAYDPVLTKYLSL